MFDITMIYLPDASVKTLSMKQYYITRNVRSRLISLLHQKDSLATGLQLCGHKTCDVGTRELEFSLCEKAATQNANWN